MAKNIFDKLVEEVDKIGETSSQQNVSTEPIKKAAKSAPLEEDNSPMGKLLSANPISIPQVGDVLTGTVVDISSSSILLDLGPLGTGIVIGKEIKDGLGTIGKLKNGDLVTATLMDMENEDGYIELSIREASYDRAWEDLESKKDTQEVVPTKILDANKGGLMVELNGITGFLPVSQLSSEHYPRVEDGDKNKILEILKRLVNLEIHVKILDVDRPSEKLIVSEKAAMSEKEREVISQLAVGDVVEGEASGVVDFGAFIKFLPPSKQDSTDDKDKLEGLVHISELAWQLIDDPREIIKAGDKVRAKIIGIDDTRISLSVKALLNDPWNNVEKKYTVGTVVEGKVDKINPFGAFVYLDEDIHGLAHVSEFREVFPDKKMDEVIVPGETYKWKILSIEPKDHRMGLIFAKDGEETEVKPAHNASAVADAGVEKKEKVKKEKKEEKKEEAAKGKEESAEKSE